MQDNLTWAANDVQEGMVLWLGASNPRRKKYHFLQAGLVWLMLILSIVALCFYAGTLLASDNHR